MKDLVTEYLTLNSSKNVDKGNGIAIFCAIVSVFACSYSFNLNANNQRSLSDTRHAIRSVESNLSDVAKTETYEKPVSGI